MCKSPLSETLSDATGFPDAAAVQTLREGANVVGHLTATGLGTPHDYGGHEDPCKLVSRFGEVNRQMISSLREDKHADFLLSQMQSDFKAGRMTKPVTIEQIDLDSVLLARGFSREQGTKPDGSLKIRAVYDETANGVNGSCEPHEKLHNDHLDGLARIICLLSVMGHAVKLWKADIDSAYRRIPVKPEHRMFLWIAVLCRGTVWVAGHTACAFGCTASVHAWNRIGALLAHIARVFLHLPVLRYVDDYFSADRAEVAEHAMNCFARIVRALLGHDSVNQKKLEWGMPLSILGVDVSIHYDRITMWPTADKIAKWLNVIRKATESSTLSAGDAGKLAGGLGFACQYTFKGLGRAIVRPLFAQQYKPLRHGRASPLLKLALRWWEAALQMPLQKTIPLQHEEESVINVFCDARGTPARVGAVIVNGPSIKYTDWPPPQAVLDALVKRQDEQIMAQELIAIVVGLFIFLSEIRGRSVRIWTDNMGGEGSLHKGASRSWDHNMIAHGIWLFAARNDIALFVSRVGTHDNISDNPSREEYEILRAIGATYQSPSVPDEVWEPKKWAEWTANDVQHFGSETPGGFSPN